MDIHSERYPIRIGVTVRSTEAEIRASIDPTGADVYDSVDSGIDELDALISEFTADPAAHAALEDAATRFQIIATLKACRKALDLNQGAVAEKMGTTQSAVSKFEGGVSDPHLSTIMRYARSVGARISLRVCIEGGNVERNTSEWAKRASPATNRTPQRIRPIAPGAITNLPTSLPRSSGFRVIGKSA